MSTPRVVLVTFVGPRRTIDAAANAEVPLRELLGPVQELLGLDTATTGPGATVVRLLPAGDAARTRMSELTRSLADLGAVDGDLLTFAPRHTSVSPVWAAPAPGAASPAGAPPRTDPTGTDPTGTNPTRPPAPTGHAPHLS